MKPSPTPVAIEKVKGMASAVTTAGAYSVTSSQSMSAMPRAMIQATNKMAGAVAKLGIVVAMGEKTRARRNRTATVTAVRPLRPPALMPAALSI